jgi:hypothetical protein
MPTPRSKFLAQATGLLIGICVLAGACLLVTDNFGGRYSKTYISVTKASNKEKIACIEKHRIPYRIVGPRVQVLLRYSERVDDECPLLIVPTPLD